MLLFLLVSLPIAPLLARPRTWRGGGQSGATMLSPTPGSTLPGSTATFQWAAGSGVKAYSLDLNTQPGNPVDPVATQFFTTGTYYSTSVTVSSLPTNGETIYAILGSEINGSWHYVTYSYQAAGSSTAQPVAQVSTLSASASSLTFGNVSVGTAMTQSLILTSTGNAAVTVGGASISAAGFTFSGANFPITLNPSQSATLTVQFNPTVAGPVAGTLTLMSNSSTGSSTAIGLSGTGVPVLAGLTCANGSMTGAGTDTCTVTLNAAAASGGFAVGLASNNNTVSVPASVTVPAGSSSAAFTATVSSVSTAATATLTASAGGVNETFALQLTPGTSTLSVSPSSVNFGSVSVNTATTQSITLNSTGNASVTISADAISGAGFTVSGATFPLTLNSDHSATLTVQFDPTVAGAASGTLTLTSNSSSGSSTAIGLSGTGVPVLSGLSCANGSMTGAGTDSCTVTLNAPAASGGIAVSLASNNSAVTVPASVIVASGASSATFTATVTSVSTAQTVTLTASANSVSKTFALQLGAGSSTLTVNATTIAFGDVNVSSPAAQPVTLTSSGTAAVTVNSATASGTGFTVSGATFPLTLNPTQTATLTVQFDPTAAGAVTGALTIASNSSVNPTDAVTLTGTGVSIAYEVNLSWNAPSSSPDPVAGYNVYRAPSGSTSYQQINPSELSQTTVAFTDMNVQGGQIYDYIVESIDASGVTSVPSNMSPATIP